MKSITLKWTGIRPLLMHNGLLADPTNPITKEKKAITSKGTKKMTDFDYENLDRLEWDGALYWSEKDGPVIPSDNIERCLQLGAQKSRMGKDVQASVFCVEPEISIQYNGPRTKDAMYKDDRFVLRKGVAVNRSRVIRVRPMIPTGWTLEFVIEFDESVINSKAIDKAAGDAGALIGLGDWRPKFGRFISEVIES